MGSLFFRVFKVLGFWVSDFWRIRGFVCLIGVQVLEFRVSVLQCFLRHLWRMPSVQTCHDASIQVPGLAETPLGFRVWATSKDRISYDAVLSACPMDACRDLKPLMVWGLGVSAPLLPLLQLRYNVSRRPVQIVFAPYGMIMELAGTLMAVRCLCKLPMIIHIFARQGCE